MRRSHYAGWVCTLCEICVSDCKTVSYGCCFLILISVYLKTTLNETRSFYHTVIHFETIIVYVLFPTVMQPLYPTSCVIKSYCLKVLCRRIVDSRCFKELYYMHLNLVSRTCYILMLCTSSVWLYKLPGSSHDTSQLIWWRKTNPFVQFLSNIRHLPTFFLISPSIHILFIRNSNFSYYELTFLFLFTIFIPLHIQ